MPESATRCAALLVFRTMFVWSFLEKNILIRSLNEMDLSNIQVCGREFVGAGVAGMGSFTRTAVSLGLSEMADSNFTKIHKTQPVKVLCILQKWRFVSPRLTPLFPPWIHPKWTTCSDPH